MGNSNLQEVVNITEKEMYVVVSELETEGSWKTHISEYYPNFMQANFTILAYFS